SSKTEVNHELGLPLSAGRVKVRSSDDALFEVELQVALQSLTIKAMVGDLMDGGTSHDFVVPLPNVSSQVLAKVLEFCCYHHQHRRPVAPPSPQSSSVLASSIAPTPAPAPSTSATPMPTFNQPQLLIISYPPRRT
ncbi:hypothetical protein GOP47_0024211, partial [Adiantum capillus-veneris]